MLNQSEIELNESEKAGRTSVNQIKNMFENSKSRSSEQLRTVSKEMDKSPEFSLSMNDGSVLSVSKLKQYFEHVQTAMTVTPTSNKGNGFGAKSNTVPRCRRLSVKLVETRKSTVSNIIAGFQTTTKKPPRQSQIEITKPTTEQKSNTLQNEQECQAVMYENIFICNCSDGAYQENSEANAYENVSFCRKGDGNTKIECLFNSKSELLPSEPSLQESEDEPIYDYPTARPVGIWCSKTILNDRESTTDSDGGSGDYEPVGEGTEERQSFVIKLSNEIDKMFTSILEDNFEKPDFFDEDFNSSAKEQSVNNAINRPCRGGTFNDIQFNCTGITCLRNGQVIMANLDGELYVFDREYKFKFFEYLMESFQDLTTISDNIIAATCGYAIRFYQIRENNIKELEDRVIDFFSSDVTVHGISYARDRLVVSCNLQSVGFHLKCFIRVMDTRGKIIQDIKRLQLQKRCLRFPHYVLADSTVDRVYVSDLELKLCLCLTYGGEVLWETKVSGVPQGLTSIENNIALAIEDQKHIAVFSKRGKPVDLIKLKVKENAKPCFICYNEVDKSLIVSSQSVDIMSCLHVIKIDDQEEKQLTRSPCKIS